MTVNELAQLVGGAVHGDGETVVSTVAQLESAGSGDVTYAEGRTALLRAAQSRAGCIIVRNASAVPARTTIEVSNPKLALIRAARALAPARARQSGIHPSAVVARGAALGDAVYLGPHVIIEDNVRVGNGAWIEAGVFVGEGAEIGADCVLHAGVILYAGARLGNRVVLHAGVVIGGDGFGYVFAEGRHFKFPQAGRVVIGDDVDIGANTTVDRGSLGATVIGAGTKIDNLVQIAHNVRIGRHTIIAAQTGISGSVEIGDYVVIGGQVGIGDHVRIEDRAVIGSQAGILPGKIIRSASVVWGTPARPLAEFKQLYAQFAKLPALARKVKEIEKSRR